MSRKLLAATIALAALVCVNGCATRATASGGRETSLLGGVVTVSTRSFQPPPPTTLDVDTSKVLSTGNPSGRTTTLLWGLITLHDY